jgi:hypothetical protein
VKGEKNIYLAPIEVTSFLLVARQGKRYNG